MSGASSEAGESDESCMSIQPTFLMYEQGELLNLKAHDLGNRLVTARIVRIYRPMSHSCVMSVEILNGLSRSDNVSQRAVLKLYDRRFAQGLREEHKIERWDARRESAFIEFVNSDQATRFISALQQPEYMEEPESGWSAAESEAYLQSWCMEMFATELETYKHLKPLQGNQIPKVFSSISLSTHSPTGDAPSGTPDGSSLLRVHGILMEHIVGDNLIQMPDFVPKKHWQAITNDALNIVHTLSDYGVINEGVRAANIIASPPEDKTGAYRVVMLGFAQCSLRQAGQTDAEWERLKAEQDEEGALGQDISAVLKKVGFDWKYVPSNRFQTAEADG